MMKLANNNEIVMVDDDHIDSEYVKYCLDHSKLQNKFLYFNSGESFLEHMKKVSNNSAAMPSIVLLDINMPKMDGFEVLEKLRSYSEFKDLPVIIFYTNSDNPRDMERAESLNAGFREKFSNRGEAISFFESLV